MTQFLDTVFTPAVYQQAWYNADPFTKPANSTPPVFAVPGELGYIRRQLKIVNGMRFWQARVTNSSCDDMQVTQDYAARFRSAAGGMCFGNYVFGVNQATAPYGPPWAPARYTYYRGPSLRSLVYGLPGWSPVSNYGNAGYTVYLPSADDPAYGSQGPGIISQLIVDKWWDRATRMFVIDFNVFNADSGYLSAVRLVLEIDRNGLILPKCVQRGARAARRARSANKFRRHILALFSPLPLPPLLLTLAAGRSSRCACSFTQR